MFTLHALVPLELAWLLYLANVAVASLLVCGAALLVQRCWPNRTLPLRHLILLGGLMVTLAVPLIVGLSNAAGWSLIEISALPSEADADEATQSAEPTTRVVRQHAPIDESDSERPIVREDELDDDQTSRMPVPFSHEAAGPAVPVVERALDRPAEPASFANWILGGGALLLAVWLGGSLYQACRFVQGLLRVRGFLGTVAPIDDPRLLRLASAAAQSVGLRRLPPLSQSAAIDSPISVGVLRGQVVLPAAQLREWSDEAWRALLLHEMAHIRRRDLLVGFMQRLAIVLYWWNPLLRLVSERIAVVREQICDDLVTQHGAREDHYAALIVELAGRMVTRQSVGPVLAAADGTPGELAGRIRRLLDPRRKLSTVLSRTMKLAVAALCVAMVVGVGSLSVRWVAAQDQVPSEPKNSTTGKVSLDDAAAAAASALSDAAMNPTLHKKVLVVDQHDKPVVGAKITPWATRSALGHGFKANQPPPATTAADGIATIPFPKYVNADEKIPALQLTCRVEHPDFATTSYNDVPVTPDEVDQQSTIKLAPGARIEITPVAEGVVLDRDRLFALWSSPVASPEIREVGADNRITLPRLPAGEELLRIAYLPAEGPAMFSDVLSQKTQDGESYSLSAVLKPAIQVTGQLDESVPRPVENGIVVAGVIELNEGEPAHSASVDWRVWSRIEKDGSFVLGPVPPGQLQVIALCDGFIAESGSPPAFVDERERKIYKSFSYPQVFTVNQTNHAIRLAMTKTAECIVRVVDPQGQPIEGAKCAAGPNVKWWGGGSQIYAHPLLATSESLTSSIKSLATSRMKEPTPFRATTDAHGIARIKNLPLQEDDFVVGHEKFEAPINGNRRYQSMELSLDRPCEVTVTMQPKGTQRIGDLPAALLEQCPTPAAKNKAAAPADKPEVKADKPAATPEDDSQTSMPEKKVRVVDAEGKPIAGATIIPWGIRSRDGHLHMEGIVGRRTLPAVTTDADGLATVHYPRLLLVESTFHVEALTCRVEHAGFADLPQTDLSLLPADVDQMATITMARGAKITIRPMADAVTFEPERLFAQWSGDNPDFKVHVTDKGLIELPRLPTGDTMFRAVYLPLQSPAMFSEMPDVENLQEGQELTRDMHLVPGVRVRGRLDDSVPRPVTGGVVVAEVTDGLGKWQMLNWRVWSKIDEDGTFLLDRVPAGDLQVTALCDGFMAAWGSPLSSHVEVPLSDTGIGRPQVFPVSLQADRITIKMTPTADLTIRVQNEGGQSVPGVHFNSMPQVRWWNGRNGFYCLPLYSTAERLQGLTINEASRRTPQDFPYYAKTDASGTAVLRNLPRGQIEVSAMSGVSERFQVDLSKGSREMALTQRSGGKLNAGEVPAVPVGSTTADKARNSKSLPPPVIKTSPAPTELAGVVVDEQGQPLADVKVDAYTWFPGNETKTDPNGRFSLRGFDYDEELEVEFTKPGYSSSLFIDQKVGTDNWTVVLTQGTELAGRVLDPQGTPVPRAAVRASRWRVQADGRLTNPVWTDTTTDDEGRYRFDVDPAATYQIDVRVPGVGVVRERNVRLAAKEKKTLDLKLGAGITFAATLHDSESGEPAAGIILWQSRDVSGTSDNQGKLTITDLVPGEYHFRVLAVGEDLLDGDVAGKFARWWSPQATKSWERLDPPDSYGFQHNVGNLTYEIGDQPEPVEILLEPAATISGRVLDPDGNPVAGATVAPAKTGSGNSLTGDTRYSTMTDDQGRFTMIAPAGKDLRYNLIAHDGKYQEWRNWANGTSENLRTLPGSKLTGIELRLTRGGTVRGRVVDTAGNPKAHVRVRAAAADRRDNRYYLPTTRADENGEYELRFVSPGEQYIQVEPFQSVDRSPRHSIRKVSVESDGTASSVDFQIEDKLAL